MLGRYISELTSIRAALVKASEEHLALQKQLQAVSPLSAPLRREADGLSRVPCRKAPAKPHITRLPAHNAATASQNIRHHAAVVSAESRSQLVVPCGRCPAVGS